MRACNEFGWYNRNTGYNPYMTEGKKTVCFEIAAQLAEEDALGSESSENDAFTPFASPDAVFVSVGDGSIIGGVYKGFWELNVLGWGRQNPPHIRRTVPRPAPQFTTPGATAWTCPNQ